MTTEDSLRNRAYHEAGHAVASIALGREMELLSLGAESTSGGVSGGRCVTKELEPPDDDLDSEEVTRRRFDSITIKVAGPLAQVLACGGGLDRLGASSDLEAARELTYSLVGEDLDKGLAVLDLAIPRAHRILKEHPAALRVLAQTLLERKELSGDEVREIMASDKD